MPFRIRKSLKIAPGTRLNISKSGIATSVGSGWFRWHSPKANAGCLYYLFVFPFVLVFNLYYLLFTGIWTAIKWVWGIATATPQSKKISLVIVGVLSICFACSTLVSAVSQAVNKKENTPTPFVSRSKQISIETQAEMTVQVILTQTAFVTSTPFPTATLIPTDTAIPSQTQPPLSTATVIYVPPTLSHPAGTTGQCVDGSYTSAAHKQGACSRHGGIAIWWGP